MGFGASWEIAQNGACQRPAAGFKRLILTVPFA